MKLGRRRLEFQKVYSDYYLSAAAGVDILYSLVDVIGGLEGD